MPSALQVRLQYRHSSARQACLPHSHCFFETLLSNIWPHAWNGPSILVSGDPPCTIDCAFRINRGLLGGQMHLESDIGVQELTVLFSMRRGGGEGFAAAMQPSGMCSWR